MCDFTAEVGDSVYNVENAASNPVVIVDVHTETIGGVSRKVMLFDGGYTWIEGIGGTYGFFAHAGPNLSEYSINLTCFSHSDTTQFEGWSIANTPGNCSLTTGLDENHDTNSIRTIYPNPTTGEVIVDLGDYREQSTIFVHNSLGQVVQLFSIPAGSKRFNFQLTRATGLYQVTLSFENGDQQHFKVLKN